jgi:hypothetical protein
MPILLVFSSCANDLVSTEQLTNNDRNFFDGAKSVEVQELSQTSTGYQLQDTPAFIPGRNIVYDEAHDRFIIKPSSNGKNAATVTFAHTYRGFAIISVNGDFLSYKPENRQVYYLAYKLGKRLYVWANIGNRSVKRHIDINPEGIIASILGIDANKDKEFNIPDRETLDEAMKIYVNLVRSQKIAPEYIFAFSPV